MEKTMPKKFENIIYGAQETSEKTTGDKTSLKERIKKYAKDIQEMCAELSNTERSYFGQPAELPMIVKYEVKNGVSIPDEYKEWLRITANCSIFGGTVQLFLPETSGYYNNFVPKEYAVIGDLVGDGEKLCIERTTGKLICYNHGIETEVNSFEDVLEWIRIMLKENIPSEQKQPEVPIEKIIKMSFFELYLYFRNVTHNKYRFVTDTWNKYVKANKKRADMFMEYLRGEESRDDSNFRKTQFDEIQSLLRIQSVKDFWKHERDKINLCEQPARTWSEEQEKQIMNIDPKDGEMRKNAGRAMLTDASGNEIYNEGRMNILFECHQMFDSDHFPSLAGEYKNLQPLTPSEHFIGAHKSTFKYPTHWYYNPVTEKNKDLMPEQNGFQ